MSREQDGPKLSPPELGAYRYGVLTGAYYMRSQKFGHPEVKIVGTWEGEGHGHWWANWKAVTALCAAGMLTQLSGDGKKFQVTPGTRCCIYREPAGGDSQAHNWFVVIYDDANAVITLTATVVPYEPQDAPAASPGQQAGPPGAAAPAAPAPGAAVLPPQAGRPEQARPGAPNPPPPAAPPSAAANDEARAKRDKLMVAQVDAVLGMSLAIAAYRHVQTFNRPLEELDQGAVQDSAACVMIRLEHLGYDPLADRSRAYVKRLRQLEDSLFPEDGSPLAKGLRAAGEALAAVSQPATEEAQSAAEDAARDAAEDDGVGRDDFPEVPAGKTADGLDIEDDDLPF